MEGKGEGEWGEEGGRRKKREERSGRAEGGKVD